MNEQIKDNILERIKNSPHYPNMKHLSIEKQKIFAQIIGGYYEDIAEKMHKAGLAACFDTPLIKFGYVFELDENKQPTKESFERYQKLGKENKRIPI